MGINYLIESALLTHGLFSISNAELAAAWPRGLENIAWVDQGEARVGSIEEFLPFRARAAELIRIDCHSLDRARQEGISGALTASGTMALCQEMGIPLAVSCGIGGIGDIQAERLCPDLPALQEIPVILLATAFKDMLDIPASVAWLRAHGVRMLGIGTDCCTGYLFAGAPVALDGSLQVASLPARGAGLLLLNPIPEEARIPESSYLQAGIQAGKAAEERGEYYHPAANAAFDRLTGGRSSRIQLTSIIANGQLAQAMTGIIAQGR